MAEIKMNEEKQKRRKMLKERQHEHISEKGFWVGLETRLAHAYDNPLCESISSYLKSKGASSVLDLGCGYGPYTKKLRSEGFKCDGYDGNPDTPKMSLENTGIECGVLDLSVPFSMEKRDWVLCLEVGEHIPKEYEEILIKNLHDHNKHGIILSWAIEGQSGYGHVNCRNNDYIINKFTNLGYEFDESSTETLRLASKLKWYKNTILVFEKK